MKTLEEYGVKMEAWGPLAQGNCGIWDNKTLIALSKKYGKTVAQIVLRWHIQRGVIVIPKSVHKERIKSNLQIFDFELSSEEMQGIANLDTGERYETW